MKQYPIYLFFLLLIVLTNQKTFADNKPQSQNDINISGYLYLFPHTFDGSPYLYNSWSIGSVFLTNGERIDNVRLKYNRLTSELVFYHEKHHKLFVVDPLYFNSFTLNNEQSDSLFFSKYKGETVGLFLKQGDFLNCLYEGKMKFLVKRSASIISSKGLDTKDEIILTNKYYLQYRDKINELKLNKRSLIKLFPIKKQGIKKIARKNHFSRKSEANMIKLISALDE